MDLEEHETPQKETSVHGLWKSAQFQRSGSSSSDNATPSSKYKSLHPRTPKSKVSTYMTTATATASISSCSSFHIFSGAVFNTPPAKRFHRVRNPFEAALAERLHLPLIGSSPSLFQRPVTPQMSSTQFEWTIDEVSSLKPANVEPHETQFQDSPDPEYEAKAQSAISSYFKEQRIVPSPVDCPLRTQRIILSELNGNTPVTKPVRRIRDCGTQTELTLPVELPKALAEALRPYMQPHLAASERVSEKRLRKSCEDDEAEDRTSTASSTCMQAADGKDVSLRRKLFDMHNIIVLDSENKTPTDATKHSNMQQQQHNKPTSTAGHSNSSPLSLKALQPTAIVGKLSDSLDKSSFGSLSPISATDGLSLSSHSPHENTNTSKSRLLKFLHDLDEEDQLSPIQPPSQRSKCTRRKSLKNSINAVISKEHYRADDAANVTAQTSIADMSNAASDDNGKFTPERSSSPMHNLEAVEFSIDSSINFKVSRLVVNSAKCGTAAVKASNVDAGEMLLHDDTEDMLLYDDDDDMQVSQVSTRSSNCSSINSDTPRSKRRSASRKNLSQSFSAGWLEEEEALQQQEEQEQAAAVVIATKQLPTIPKINDIMLKTLPVTKTAACSGPNKLDACTNSSTFYRTDSGFNEMTVNSCSAFPPLDEHSREATDVIAGKSNAAIATDFSALDADDIDMVCCSTPSKQRIQNYHTNERAGII